MIEIGTPIWIGAFGCIAWVGDHLAGVRLLSDGVPKLVATVPHEVAEIWAQNWLDVQEQDGRIEEVVVQ